MLIRLAKYYLSLHYWHHAPLEAVKRMQLRKFRAIFEHARQHSKFYNDLYKEHGIMDLKIKSWEDIRNVPVINKSMLRKYETEDLMTCPITSNINIHSTSGSSGEPFKIAYSKFEDYSAHVRLTKTIMQHGYTPFKKLVLLSRYEPGHAFEVEDDLSTINLLQKKLKLFPKEVISMFDPIDQIIEKLQTIKPYIIWSTPSFIQLLASRLETTGHQLTIPICFLMAETISTEQIQLFRERICENVIDAYGCMEAPSMGFSINSNQYKNLIPNTTMAEVINPRIFNGENVGDLIITNLLNRTMPFIRYDLGDFVEIIENNSFPFRKIGKVHGRFEDIMSLNNNQTLSFHQSYQLFHGFHEVEQYKFIQTPDEHIVLQLKVQPETNKDEVKRKAIKIWSSYYPEVPLTIEWKDEFGIDQRTGKFKVIEKMRGHRYEK